MGLTLRQDKGLPLDNAEVDGNFVYLEGLSEQNSTALETHKSSSDHDARYPLKTTTVTGTGALTGGGGLGSDQQIDASPETKASLAKADSALQPDGNLAGLTDKAAARTNLGLGTSATVDASVTPAAGKIPLGGSAGTIQTVWVQDLSYKLDQYLAQLTALRSPSATPSLYQEWGHGASMLHPAFTFTRATTSTYIENGVLKTAAANVPVFEDGGLRIEPQATNYARYGNSLTGWFVKNCTVSSVAGVDPFGNMTTVKRLSIQDLSTGSSCYVNLYGEVFAANTDFWVGYLVRKTASVGYCYGFVSAVIAGGTVTAVAPFYVDLQTGTVTGTPAGLPAIRATMLNNDWVLVEVKNITTASGATLNVPYFGPAISENSIQFPAHSVAELDAYAAWYTLGSARTSYIPNDTSGPVTRATDSASITGSNFASIYNPASGSLILSGDSYYMRSDIANNVLRLSDQMRIRRDVDGYLYLVRAGQSDLQILSSNQATNNLALAWGSNGLDIFVNGAKKHADLVIPGGTIDSLILADSDTAAQNIKRLGIYKQRLTDELLEGLTS